MGLHGWGGGRWGGGGMGQVGELVSDGGEQFMSSSLREPWIAPRCWTSWVGSSHVPSCVVQCINIPTLPPPLLLVVFTVLRYNLNLNFFFFFFLSYFTM